MKTWRILILAFGFGVQPIVAQGGSSCPASSVEVLEDAKLLQEALTLIDGAQNEIWVATYHFKAGTNPRSGPDRVAHGLILAAKRGVRVTVLLERPEDPLSEQARDNAKTARILERAGVRVLWDRPERRSHMKVMVVDGRYSIVGSHNLTKGGLRDNHELSVKLDSPCTAERILSYLKRIARDGGIRLF